MAVPNIENDRSAHMSVTQIRQAARRLREMFGESTKNFVTQGDFIISRLRVTRPDALAAPQGKKLMKYVSEGQRALACLPLLEAGWLRENDTLTNLEETMQKIDQARVVLSHAARKRSRSFSGRIVNSEALSDCEADTNKCSQLSSKKSKYHSYAGGDGAYIARMATADHGKELWDTSVIKRLHNAKVEVPDEFICPLTLDIMREPILLTGDGRNYEKSACARWLVKNNTSPVTHEPLPSCNFMAPAHSLKARISLYLEEHKNILQPTKEIAESEPVSSVVE